MRLPEFKSSLVQLKNNNDVLKNDEVILISFFIMKNLKSDQQL